ncbi:hypothetical protein [Spirosoma luteum]|uniref:hypothetical protein n=1 Tax=Spirosoma luteum TaxID=431553 RepID=UPI000374F7A2|nr:hypothetical protein [Spirosoma luteum]
MTTNSIESELAGVLQEVIGGLSNPDNHYTVLSNYYDHLTPGRVGERWYMAQIWFNTDTVSDVELTDEGLVCSVRLNERDRDQISRIVLPYSQIWQVQSINAPSLDLYCRTDKRHMKRPSDKD